MPNHPAFSIARGMREEPIPIHQARKYGFKAVRTIPVIIGAGVRDSYFASLLENDSLTVMIPKYRRNTEPRRPSQKFALGFFKRVMNPTERSMTSGNSTIVWPILVSIPAFHPFLRPAVAVAAVRGPGASAPEALTTMILMIKSNIITAFRISDLEKI